MVLSWGRCKWWESFLRSNTPQSDKLRGRGGQLSLLSPLRDSFWTFLTFILFLSFIGCLGGKREDRSCHLGVLHFSLSVLVLALTCSFSILSCLFQSLPSLFSAFLLLTVIPFSPFLPFLCLITSCSSLNLPLPLSVFLLPFSSLPFVLFSLL